MTKPRASNSDYGPRRAAQVVLVNPSDSITRTWMLARFRAPMRLGCAGHA